MRERVENLLYVDKEVKPRDFLDKSFDALLLGTVKTIETDGTEDNIPREGPLVEAFAPHSGFLELVVIDHYLRQIRQDFRSAVWITKIENAQALPSWVRGDRRFIYVDRDYPKSSTIRTISRILANDGIIGSAIEGTRYGTGDKEGGDTLTLCEFKPGLMYFAYLARVPIQGVVVLGAEQVIPEPEKIKDESGTLGVLRALLEALMKREARLQVRFLPAYTQHLSEEASFLTGIQRIELIKMHTKVLARDLITEILRIRPDYPLGINQSWFENLR